MTDKKQEPLPSCPFCQKTVNGMGHYAQCKSSGCPLAYITIHRDSWALLIARTPTPAREDLARAEVLEYVAGIFESEVGEGTMPERMRQFAASLRQNSGLPPSKSEDEVRAEVWEEAAAIAEAAWTSTQTKVAPFDVMLAKAKALRAGKREEWE